MFLNGSIRSLLLSWSEVTSLLTKNTGSNDYPIRPERLHESDPLPAIEICQPEEDFEDDLSGNQQASTSTVVISVVATDAVQANQIADAILTRGASPATGLLGFSGQAGSVIIQNSVKKIRRGYAPNPDGSDSGEYVVSIENRIYVEF